MRGHYRGARWFSWLTGVPPLIWLGWIAGLTGLWLLWDALTAQSVHLAEWLQCLPLMGEGVVREFPAEDALNDRFFLASDVSHRHSIVSDRVFCGRIATPPAAGSVVWRGITLGRHLNLRCSGTLRARKVASDWPIRISCRRNCPSTGFSCFACVGRR